MHDLKTGFVIQCAQMGDSNGRSFFIKSDSDPKVIYCVTAFSDHFPVNCNCPAAVNNRGGKWRDKNENARCKHVRYVLDSVCTWTVGLERYSGEEVCPRCKGPLISYE